MTDAELQLLNVGIGLTIWLAFMLLIGFIYLKQAREEKYEYYRHLMQVYESSDREVDHIFLKALHALSPYLGLKSISVGYVDGDDDTLSLILEVRKWVKYAPNYRRTIIGEAAHVRKLNPKIKVIHIEEKVVDTSNEESAL